MEIRIRQANLFDQHDLANMCALLWPDSPAEDHLAELAPILSTGRYGTLPTVIFVSQNDDGPLTGFLHASLRSHADGCDVDHIVGFVEGWFVHEPFRNRGDIASDTWIDDQISIGAHLALGFEIVDRCVHFRKPL
jgi:aminoglycoside 6'-N-acetyltransferase I